MLSAILRKLSNALINGGVLDSTGVSLNQAAVVGKRYMHKQISGNRTNYAFA